MHQARWALTLLALCGGCVVTPQTPVEQLQTQSTLEKRVAVKALAPPSYIILKSNVESSKFRSDLNEVEKTISPIAPGERAAAAMQESTPSWLTKARDHARQRELDQAMQLLLKVVREDSKNALAWREMARLLDAAGRRETALSAWDQVLALVPLDVEALTASGLDALAGKKYVNAAEKLFLARRVWLTVEPTSARLKMQVATAAGLATALRELNYTQAAASCFHEAAQLEISLGAQQTTDGNRPHKQAQEFLRFAGECEASIGQWDTAAESFTQSLAQSDSIDATSLPPAVWALACSGRPAAARQLLMATLINMNSPGRAGAPCATQWLKKNGFSQPLQAGLQQIASTQDALIARCMLACGHEHAVDFILTSAPSILENEIALREMVNDIAASQGVPTAVQIALDHVEKKPESAPMWAAALRALPFAAKQLRADIQAPSANKNNMNAATNNATRALLGAWFDLVGFDSLLALHIIEPFTDSRGALASAVRIAALNALAIEQDLGKIERLEKVCDPQSAPELAALAQAFLESGENNKAIEYVERAISLDKKCAQAWMARAAIDLSIAVNSSIDAPYERKKEAALEARNSFERAMEAAPNNRMAARKFLEVASPERGIAPDVDAFEVVMASQSQQVLREVRREKALSSLRRNQSSFNMESLRMLLIEDPLDASVGQAILSAAAETGRLVETEKFLDALVLAHPSAAELGEVDLSCKARQGRLLEAIEILKSALALDPDSDALTRGCIRSLMAAGKKMEALSVIDNAPERLRNAAGRTQLERIEFELSLKPNAAAQEMHDLVASGRLSKNQRKTAVILAHQLPKNMDKRLALQAALAKPLLDDAKVQPIYVAYAMLDGTLEEARALSKEHTRAWPVVNAVEAAQLLADEGMFMRAEYLLHDCGALSKDKNKSQLFRAELACLIAKGNVGKASQRLAQEREQNQFHIKDPQVTSAAEDLAELGNAFLMASDPVAAEECFQSAVDLAPNIASAMNNLAWLRMERNEIDAATIDLIRRALVATPNDSSTLDTAGWLAYRQGRLRDMEGSAGALTLLQKSLDKAQDKASPESMDHCADALYRAGEIQQATQLWRAVADQGVNKSSRENVANAFFILQQREWGIRAWNADAFYNRNDGAAIERAKKKLNSIAQGGAPELAEMDFAPTSANDKVAPVPASDTVAPKESRTTPEGAK